MSPFVNPLIRKLEQHSPLDEAERSAITAACTRVVSIGRGEDVVRDGEIPGDSSLLLEGWVFRYKILHDGSRQILSFQFPGDIYDAQSFILERMDHSIATLTPCKVAVIPHQALLALTERYPRIARALWRDTMIDSAVFREWITNVGRRQAVARIAHIICEVTTRLKVVGLSDGTRLEWPITQAELGDAAGLSFVHVNRSLQKLRSLGLITLQGRELVILNWDALEETAGFEPGYLHLGAATAA